MTSKLPLLFATALAVALATPAAAVQIDVSNVAVPLWVSGVDISYGSHSYTGVIAGQIVLHAAYAGAIASPAFDVYAWCVDLFHDVYLGANTYHYILGGAVTNDGNGATLSSLTGNQLMTLAAYGNARLAGADAGNADVSTAIQLAIWQTEYPGFTFSANAAITSHVAEFEAYAASHVSTNTSLTSLEGAQALVTDTIRLPPGDEQEVPEPFSGALLLTGLVGLGVTRRKLSA